MNAPQNWPGEGAVPPATGLEASAQRIGALVLRYWYLIWGSWPRLVELVYWPVVQMMIWGFLQTYFAATQATPALQVAGTLIGAVLLWDVLFRGQLGFSLSFFEEVWSRNLGHLMVSPLRPAEFIAALASMSMIRTLIGLAPASLLAIWFFGFSIYGLGLSLVAFFFGLVMFGWSVGLIVCGLVLRFGQGAENFAWAIMFGLAPFIGVWYPVEALPAWLHPFAAILPPSHIFEGMRSILIEGTVRLDLMATAFALNIVYLIGGGLIFAACLRAARRTAVLLQVGE